MIEPSLLDINVYLAQLASNPARIDPILDPMRLITAKSGDRAAQLTSDDKRTLEKIRASLENYLVTEEPLRSFTHGSLRQRLYEHFEGSKRIRHSRRIAALATSLMTLAIIVILFGSEGSVGRRLSLAAAAALATGFLGLLYLFLSALKTFSPGTRQAFYLICGGIAVLSPYLVLMPFLLSNFQGNLPLVWAWLVGAVFPVGFTLIYFGFRKLAVLLGIHNWATKAWLVMGATLATALVVWLPFGLASKAGAGVYGLVVADRWIHTFLRVPILVLLMLMVKRTQGAYRDPFLWSFWTSLALSIGSAIETIAFSVTFPGWVQGGPLALDSPVVANVFFIISVILSLRAGYGFNKLNKY